MRPMYATNVVVTIEGEYLVYTFENNSLMTSVKVSKNTADKLANETQDKRALQARMAQPLWRTP